MGIQGKRKDIPTGQIHLLETGDYGKDENGIWYCYPPVEGSGPGCLQRHTVIEHEDGTITVTPSILITGSPERSYHGWLTNGIWLSC